MYPSIKRQTLRLIFFFNNILKWFKIFFISQTPFSSLLISFSSISFFSLYFIYSLSFFMWHTTFYRLRIFIFTKITK